MIKCSVCDESFSHGFDYRMHWDEMHLDYAMEQLKIENEKRGRIDIRYLNIVKKIIISLKGR